MGVISSALLGGVKMLFHGLIMLLRFAWPIVLLLILYLILRRVRRAAARKEAAEEESREPTFRGPVYTVDYKEVPEDEDKDDL